VVGPAGDGPRGHAHLPGFDRAGQDFPGVGGYIYRILDIASGHVTELVGLGLSEPVGFLGDELIVYATMDEARIFPLAAIGDGTTRTLVDTEGFVASVFPSATGPQLVYDGHDDQSRYLLRALGVGDESPRTLFVGEAPWYDPPSGMASHSVETPGWVPILPAGLPYLSPDMAEAFAGAPRRIVSLADASVVELPALGRGSSN
jgi:hypothetical protein